MWMETEGEKERDAREVLPGERLLGLDEARQVLLHLALAEGLLIPLERLVELLALLVLLGEDVDGGRAGAMVERLGEEGLDAREAEPEDDRDAPVAPLLADVVVEGGRDVGAAGDDRVARRRAGEGADLVGAERGRVLRQRAAETVGRDVVAVAQEVDALELRGKRATREVSSLRLNDLERQERLNRTHLVLHGGREGEVERVDVAEPEQPALLGEDRDEVARVAAVEKVHNVSERTSREGRS